MADVVWLIEENTLAVIINRGAHYSLVRYTREGIDYEVLVASDEFNDVERGDDDDEPED